jgi:hypothetical protein
MLFKTIFKIVFKTVILVFVCLIIATLFLFINLPNILESEIEKRLPKFLNSELLNPDEIEFKIQNIGFSNTHISKIRVCDGISIDSINIDYDIKVESFPGIKYTNQSGIKSDIKIDIQKVTISGVDIYALLDKDNNLKIKDLKFSETSSKTSSNQSDKQDSSLQSLLTLPVFQAFLPSKIVVKNSKIILHAQNDKLEKELLIPFDLLSATSVQDVIETEVKSGVKTKSKSVQINVGARLYPFGEIINGLVTYDINQGLKSIQIQGKSFDIGHLNQFIATKADKVQLKGLLDFNIESSFPLKKWNIDISNIALVQPVKAQINDIKAKISIDKSEIKTKGVMQISSSLLPKISLQYGMNIDFKNSNRFDLKFETRKTDGFEIPYNSNFVAVKKPKFKASFQGVSGKIRGKIILDCKNANIQNKRERAGFADLKLISNIVAHLSQSGNEITSKFTLSTNNINIYSDLIDSSSVNAKFATADITGKLLFDKNKSPSGSMIVKINNGEIRSSKFKTSATGINIEVPISYPASVEKSYGNYSISSILYDNYYDFSTKGEILQTNFKELNPKTDVKLDTRFNTIFKIGGDVKFNLLPDIKTQFDSIVEFDGKDFKASCEVKTNTFNFDESVMEKLRLKNMPQVEFDVAALVKSSAYYADHMLKSSMNLMIKDGKVLIPDLPLIASGINTVIEFNDLLSVETVPGQIVTIDSIEKEKIKIDDTRIRFSIEEGKSILVENIKFKWCNGLVSTESVRFPQENSEYYLSLYCDRLELTQLLEQMDIFSAKGSGTLNGRIPVKYSNGNISFDHGFLFSTPGKGGKIIIENSDRITSGIPMDSPQFSQLDLAKEALKDFNYKWAKLKFHTKNDTLFVDMELDGEPSNILPFVYSKELGGFVRVDASSPGSHFQGIKLDVNLKLPFNEVIKSGNKLKSIFN